MSGDDELAPLAAIAATRWVAWADFVAAGLAVRDGNASEVMRLFSLSEARFAAEALVDGQVSVAYARLAAHRLAGADDDFVAELELLARLMRRRQLGARYYGRYNRFTREAIDIERAEFFRTHTGDKAGARRLYQGAALSCYPLHAALGHLGLALIDVETGRPLTHADRAKEIADTIGFRLVSHRVDNLRTGAVAEAARELFFC